MCMGVLLACMFMQHVCAVSPEATSSQERMNPPVLELQVVASHHVGAWNQTWVLLLTAKPSLQSPHTPFLETGSHSSALTGLKLAT